MPARKRPSIRPARAARRGSSSPAASRPTPTASSPARAARCTSKAHIAPHRPIVDAVHEAGGVICMQILHSGRYLKRPNPVAPSPIRSPINPNTPRALTEAEIEQTIQDFANCAVLAKEAGYDGVEIMGSEGYLINQFTVLRTNQRTDSWGGSVENRHKFPVEIVKRVRAAVGKNFILVYRISALDLVEGGAEPEEILGAGQEDRGRRRRHHEHRHRLARGARADHRLSRAARGLGGGAGPHQAGGQDPGRRLQPHQHARGRRGHPGQGPGRHDLAGAADAGRSRVRRARRGRGAPTPSTPASPATRPASTTSSRAASRPASSIRAPAARSSSRPSPRRRRRGSPSSAAARPACRSRPKPPSAAMPSRCSKPPTRSAASSIWRAAFPANPSSTR